MFRATVSAAEIDFVRAGCELGVRPDGRGENDYRSIAVENGVMPHTNGSARVRVGDLVDVICSIKADVVTPLDSAPGRGFIEVAASLSPPCSLDLDETDRDTLERQLAHTIQRGLVGCTDMPWKDLCVVVGKFVWRLNVDLLVLRCDGDPLDACGLATYVAFQNLALPRVFPAADYRGELTKIEVVGDADQALDVDFSLLPVFVNIAVVGKMFVVDSTASEQAAATAVVSVGVTRSGDLCGVSVPAGGLMATSEFPRLMATASAIGKSLFAVLDDFSAAAMALENDDDQQDPDSPPERLGLLA